MQYNPVYKVPKPIFMKLNSISDTKNSHIFLSYLYEQYERLCFFEKNIGKDTYIHLSSNLIDRALGKNFQVLDLIDDGLISYKQHSQQHHTARGYRLRKSIYNDIQYVVKADRIKREYNTLEINDLVNLYSGQKAITKFVPKIGKEYPKTLIDAVNNLQNMPVNIENSRDYMLRMAKLKNLAIKHKHKDINIILGRFVNDYRAIQTIIMQLVDDSTYKPLYRPLKTGRLQELDRGFQQASRFLKYLLTKGLDIHNYDLESSQQRIYRLFFDYCGLDCSWLDNYLTVGKETLAKDIKLPLDSFKKCIISLFTGAVLSRNTNKSIYGTICDVSADPDKVFNDFSELVAPVYKEIKSFKQIIYHEFDKKFHTKHKGFKYWKNSLGMVYPDYKYDQDKKLVYNNNIPVTSKKELNQLGRKLLTFYMVGIESHFIHSLTNICTNNRIKVFKNESDGLIVNKLIDSKHIERAKNISGYKNAVFRIKPLISEKERRLLGKQFNFWEEGLLYN